MTDAKVARRYAKALVTIGMEDGNRDLYCKELDQFILLLNEYPELTGAITNFLYSHKERKGVLDAVAERMGLSVTMKSFLRVLFDNGRIQFVDAVFDAYKKMLDEADNIVRGEVRSAKKLSDSDLEKIRAAMSLRLGRQVVVKVLVEPALIGGIVTRIGDTVWDGSVRAHLAGLRETLQGGGEV